nr:aminotransferase class III-fold pyridoxal phosphate-dependent enzyme [Liquorilactobacillus nagelii]
MQKIREITNKLHIPLIIDEVQTVFGRTGKIFSFEHAGIEPDAFIISKAVGGGLPMSAVMYCNQYNTWKSGSHAGTNRGDQLAMIAGKETLKVIKQAKFLKQVNENGELMLSKLNAKLSKSELIGDIRGRGLMIGLEIDKRLNSDKRHNYSKSIKQICFECGLIITGGRNSAVLRVLPPLNVTSSEINHAVNILTNAIHTVEREMKKSEKITGVS